MAGLLQTQERSPGSQNYSGSLALGSAGDRAMGKFFLIIIAVSVAVLLAMSAYVISL